MPNQPPKPADTTPAPVNYEPEQTVSWITLKGFVPAFAIAPFWAVVASAVFTPRLLWIPTAPTLADYVGTVFAINWRGTWCTGGDRLVLEHAPTYGVGDVFALLVRNDCPKGLRFDFRVEGIAMIDGQPLPGEIGVTTNG